MNANFKIGCDKVSDLIVEYIDGELDETTSELIKQHISSCPHCAKLYRDMALVCSAAAESAYEVPEELHGRVMEAVARERATSSRRARILSMTKATRWLGVGIAAMLFICVGIAGSFKLLPKIMNIETSDSAPTETAPSEDMDGTIYDQVIETPSASGIDKPSYTDGGDSADNAEVFVYKTVKAMAVSAGERTEAPEAEAPDYTIATEKDSPAPDAPEAEEPAIDLPATEMPAITGASPTTGAPAMTEAPEKAEDIFDVEAPMTEAAEPATPISQIIVGTWEIATDSGTVRLILTGGNEPRYILYTLTTTISGSYSIRDHFLTLNVLGKDSALYIVGVEDGVMTLLQVSPNGLF